MNVTLDVSLLAHEFAHAWAESAELRCAAFVIMMQTSAIAMLLIIIKC